MPQRMPFSEIVDHDNFPGHLILNAMSSEDWGKPEFKKANEDRFFEVSFTLNGVEVDFVPFFQRVHDNLESIIENRAKELVKEKLGNSIELMTLAIDNARTFMENELQSRFTNFEPYENK